MTFEKANGDPTEMHAPVVPALPRTLVHSGERVHHLAVILQVHLQKTGASDAMYSAK